MSRWWAFVVPGLVVLMALVACDERRSKIANASGDDGGIRDGGYVKVTRTPLYLDVRLFEMGGEVDVKNEYLLAVIVTSIFSDKEERRCSGVVIGPRLVLTTGHCVCMRPSIMLPKGSNAVIDVSECAHGATVSTVRYKPPKDGIDGPSGATWNNYRGVVRPHPEFKIILDDQSQVVSSKADLAIIQLDRPVDVDVRGVPIADTDVHVGESVVIVGYEYDEVANMFGEDRRFSRNKVTQLSASEDERIRVEQLGGHLYKGDSGGPCLRQVGKMRALVGISSRNLGAGATFISTYPYRIWLHEELRRAVKLESPVPQRPMK